MWEVRLPRSMPSPARCSRFMVAVSEGGEIVRDENVRLLDREERPRRFALQIANHPTGHILDVECTDSRR